MSLWAHVHGLKSEGKAGFENGQNEHALLFGTTLSVLAKSLYSPALLNSLIRFALTT